MWGRTSLDHPRCDLRPARPRAPPESAHGSSLARTRRSSRSSASSFDPRGLSCRRVRLNTESRPRQHRIIRRCDPSVEGLELAMLRHVSPIEWDNVVLYGQYVLNRRLVRSRGAKTAIP